VRSLARLHRESDCETADPSFPQPRRPPPAPSRPRLRGVSRRQRRSRQRPRCAVYPCVRALTIPREELQLTLSPTRSHPRRRRDPPLRQRPPRRRALAPPHPRPRSRLVAFGSAAEGRRGAPARAQGALHRPRARRRASRVGHGGHGRLDRRCRAARRREPVDVLAGRG